MEFAIVLGFYEISYKSVSPKILTRILRDLRRLANSIVTFLRVFGRSDLFKHQINCLLFSKKMFDEQLMKQCGLFACLFQCFFFVFDKTFTHLYPKKPQFFYKNHQPISQKAELEISLLWRLLADFFPNFPSVGDNIWKERFEFPGYNFCSSRFY